MAFADGDQLSASARAETVLLFLFAGGDSLDVFLSALVTLLSVTHLVYLFFGVAPGLAIGILPGLGSLGVYMKRFGWSRPALLIGFVLADKVEESIYHTYAVYKWTFLERPIVLVLVLVLVLVVLTVASIWAAVRFKQQRVNLDPSGPYSHRNRAPQLVFYALSVLFALTVLVDGLRWNFLTAIYPIVSGCLALVFMIPLGIALFRTHQPAAVFYDSERDAFSSVMQRRSAEHYLLWLIGMLAVSALAGFVIGIAVFIYAFMRVKARCEHWACALGAAALVMLLGILSDKLAPTVA